VAEKYQIQGLHAKITEYMKDMLWNATTNSLLVHEEADATDCLGAMKTGFAETSTQDSTLRAALVEFCALHISDLRQLPAFSALLKEHGDLGAEIFAHDRLSLMLEGSWCCEGLMDRRAVPRCPGCDTKFPMSKLRENRHQLRWRCYSCGRDVMPVCSEHSGRPLQVKWEWEWE
jgi:hypothetical protein